MQIKEVKEKNITETRRKIAWTGLILSEEEAGLSFDRHVPDRKGPKILPDLTEYLNTHQQKAWNRLSPRSKERLLVRLHRTREYARYREYKKERKGDSYAEEYKHYGVSGKGEQDPYLGGVRHGAQEDAVPQMGGRKRQDAEGPLQAAEAHAGVGTAPGRTEERPFIKEPAAVFGTGGRTQAAAATGGLSEGMRIGLQAVRKAAKVIQKAVNKKETAKREAAGYMPSGEAQRIGGGMPSSSYAAGPLGILVRAAAAAAAAGAVFLHAMLLPVVTFMILSALFAATLFSTVAAALTASAVMGDASYLAWAVSIAEDDSHGYSQSARTGPDYDCSSLVWHALNDAGYDVGSYPFATGSMPGILAAAGFEQLPYTGMADLLPGDILWVHGETAQHTEMYLGDGQLVGACGDLDGGLPGDQSGTGAEIRVGGFYEDGWMGVFRSSVFGMGDIEIPSVYEGYDVGAIFTCTPHYGTWNWMYNQARVRDAWAAAGSVYSENVAMIDGKYLIACTDTFGQVGDWITFYFEDGTPVECIMADSKSGQDPNCTPWGHIHGSQIDVIEAETDLIINPGHPGCVASWGGHRVVAATNHGPFI